MAIEAVNSTDYYELTTSVPNGGYNHTPAGAYTAMIWYKCATNVANSSICGANKADTYIWEIRVLATSGWLANRMLQNQGRLFTDVADGAWHCLAITQNYSNGEMYVYLDGTLTQDQSSLATDTVTKFRVGADAGGTGIEVGTTLYGLKVWNVQLDETELDTEMTSYSPIKTANLYGSWLLTSATATISDDSGNGHTLTRNGSSFTTADGPPGSGTGGLMWI